MSDSHFNMTLDEERARRRAARRRRRRLQQRAIEIGALMVLTLLIALPIWLFTREKPAPELPSVSVPAVSAEPEPDLPPYPVADSQTVTFDSTVDAPYAILWDVTKERVVAARGENTPVFPASVTKVMTLLVAVENITDFTATYEMPADIVDAAYLAGATVAGFKMGEKVTIEDMLYGCILPSGADATDGLARYVAGSEEAFVTLMNDKATQLGLKNTHFVNTSGLHDNNHYTTAADMAVVMQAAMEDPHCRQVLSTYQYTTAATPQHPEGILLTSTMFSRMYGTEPEVATIIAGKTGYTSQSKHTMVSYAEGKNGHDYILVTMFGSNKWKATYDAINVYKAFCPAPVTKPTATTTTKPAAE